MNARLPRRPTCAPTRPLSRFLVFGLAVDHRDRRPDDPAVLPPGRQRRPVRRAGQGNRTVAQAIPSSRGLIYDRAGRVLVKNVPTFAVKIRPVDLPEERRDEVVAGCRRCLNMTVADINAAIDGNPGSRFDLVRIASDVPKDDGPPASPRRAIELPGVEVVVEARRQYPTGRSVSQLLGYTGPVSADQLDDLEGRGLPAGRPPRQDRRSRRTTRAAARHLRQRDGRARRLGPASSRSSRPISQAQAGDSLKLTIDVERAGARPEGAPVGHAGGRPEARRRHRHEPPDRRGPGDGQPADLRRQRVRPRDQRQGLRAAPERQEQAAAEPRDPGPLPARIDLQARDGQRRAGGRQDHRRTRLVQTRALPDPRPDQVLGVEPPRLGRDPDQLRLRPLERHVLLPARGHARDRAARLLGARVRVRRSRPGSICPARWPGSSRPTRGSRSCSASRSTPARPTRPGSARATTS